MKVPKETRTLIEKAEWLSEFYAAMAIGDTVQETDGKGGWEDMPIEKMACGPRLSSTLASWRIKPVPRRKWEVGALETYDADVAAGWKAKGWQATEWVEVIQDKQ